MKQRKPTTVTVKCMGCGVVREEGPNKDRLYVPLCDKCGMPMVAVAARGKPMKPSREEVEEWLVTGARKTSNRAIGEALLRAMDVVEAAQAARIADETTVGEHLLALGEALRRYEESK